LANDVTAKAGILLLDKPVGISSARAVAVVKRALGGAKVGHLGTLDPFASGLLPLCIAEGTKVAQYLNLADKRYSGVIRLGVETDTLDRTGETIATCDAPDPGKLDLDDLATSFTGDQDQVPPAFSAIKQDGVRMYKLARAGKAPKLEARRVRVHSLALEALGDDRLALTAHCSKGTYIRSLARDIGRRIGCGGSLDQLERTGFGTFELAQAVSLDDVGQGPEGINSAIIPLTEALAQLRQLTPGDSVSTGLRAGQQRWLSDLEPPRDSESLARVIDECGRLVAVVRADGGRWALDRVFH
jgi:tRNA pseudouridine55 synthase